MTPALRITALVAATGGLLSGAPLLAQPASQIDWSGPYVGVNAGGVVNGNTRFDRTTGDLPNNVNALTSGLRPIRNTVNDSGFTGGAQIGFNYDLGAVVAGVEADFVYTDLDHAETLSNTTNVGPLGVPSAVPVTRVNRYRSQLDYLGTLRARAGVGLGNILVYGTGGFAYGRVKQDTIFFGPNAGDTPFFAGRNKDVKWGYAVGGGAEFALPTSSFVNIFGSAAVTLRAEYLHYDLGHGRLRFPGVNGGAEIGGYTSRVRTYGDIVRAGINYKF